MRIYALEITRAPVGARPIPPKGDNSWALVAVVPFRTKSAPYTGGMEYVEEVHCYWQREQDALQGDGGYR